MEETKEEFPCGCVKEFVNGKWLWELCDEHDEDGDVPCKRPIKKFRKDREY